MTKCEKCGTKMECHAGCSAHHSNWYCPECTSKRTMNTKAYNPFRPAPVKVIKSGNTLPDIKILIRESGGIILEQSAERVWFTKKAYNELQETIAMIEDKDNG